MTVAVDARSHVSGRREQWATRAIFLLVGLAIACWAPLIPFAKARLGADEQTLGLLLLCLGFGSIIAMPITGIVANRLGCRLVIVAASIVIALALPLLAIVDTAPQLAVVLAVLGAGIGTVDVAMNIQAVMVEKDSGRSMMSGFHGLYSLGGIVGAGGASLLLSLGFSPLAITAIAAVFALVLLALAYAGLLPYGNRETAGAPSFVLPRGIVIFIGILCFITFLAEGAVLDWGALFLIGAHAADPGEAGLGYTMFAIAMTLGRLTGDRIVNALGGVRVMLLGGLLSAAGFALSVLAPNSVLSIIGFLLVGLGASNIVPVLFTAAGRQRKMPPSLAVAAITTLGYAGVLVGPAAVGIVAQHTSLGLAFLILAGCLVLVAASAPIARRD